MAAWVAPAIIGASALASSLGSKNNSGSGMPGWANEASAIGSAMEWNKTEPLRRGFASEFSNFMGGDYDVTANPVYRAGRGAIEDQYGVARENVIGNMPEGGQLLDTLADVETGRADALTGLAGGVAEDVYDKAFSWATGVPSQTTGNLTGLAGQNAMLNAQQSAIKSRNASDLGYAGGMLAGSKNGGGGNTPKTTYV